MLRQPYPSDQGMLSVRKKEWMKWVVLIDHELIKLVVDANHNSSNAVVNNLMNSSDTYS